MNSNPLSNDLNHILDHTRELWPLLQGERVFITGGTGFFGCWLLESLTWAVDQLGLDTQAVVLSRDPQAFQKKAPHLAAHPAVQFWQGDVRSFRFPEGHFAHVIHAATESSAKLNTENPLLMVDTIVEGTRRTLDFSKYCGASNFLLTSSGAVYGKQPPEMTHIQESFMGGPDLTNPNSAYGEGKRLAEHLCALYSQQFQLQTKIARCFAFVGPYFPIDIHFAIGNFIRDGFKSDQIVIQGDGTPLRSYLYAADLTIWLWVILIRGNARQTYNVGSENPISIVDLAKMVANIMSCQTAISNIQRRDYKKPERYVPSTKKARDGLGLHQWIDLEQALHKTISWQSAHLKQ